MPVTVKLKFFYIPAPSDRQLEACILHGSPDRTIYQGRSRTRLSDLMRLSVIGEPNSMDLSWVNIHSYMRDACCPENRAVCLDVPAMQTGFQKNTAATTLNTKDQATKSI